MPKYKVGLIETVRYTVEVEAESEEQAESLAWDLWANSEDPFVEFNGESIGSELDQCDKVD